MARVELPCHLRTLADVGSEVRLDLPGPVTQRTVLDALGLECPMPRGTIHDHATERRRPYRRFFACAQDLSHDSPDRPLTEPVASGAEPFVVLGSSSGG